MSFSYAIGKETSVIKASTEHCLATRPHQSLLSYRGLTQLSLSESKDFHLLSPVCSFVPMSPHDMGTGRSASFFV